MSSITIIILEILLVITATSLTICVSVLSVIWVIGFADDYGLLDILLKERDGE